MSARERLITRMAAAMPQSAAGAALDDLDAYRDEVLREAAEKINAWARDMPPISAAALAMGPGYGQWLNGIHSAADVIDPDIA